MKKQHVISNILSGLFFVLLIINISLLFYYIFFNYADSFHSDSASKVLLAREIYESQEFFPKTWNYVNGDISIVFGHIFIVPLLAFIPAGYIAHAISGSVFSLLILTGVWLLARNLLIPYWQKIAVVAFFAAGVSRFFAENLFGQGSYGVVILICLYILIFAQKYLESMGKTAFFWGALVLLLFFVAYWSNPKRALISYGLPLIGGLGWIILSNEFDLRRKSLSLVLLAVAGSVAGLIMHEITLANISNVKGAASARWLDIESVPQNILYTIKGLYAQLDGLLLGGESIFSPHGLVYAIKFLLATLVLFMIPVAIREAIKIEAKEKSLIALFAGISIASTLFLQITTTLPDMSDPIQSSRYLVPGVTLGIFVLLTLPLKLLDFSARSTALLLILVVYTLSGYNNFVKSDLSSGKILGQPGQVSAYRSELIEFIKDHDLHYGYATYWNAGVLTVLSDERLKVPQVQLHQGVPVPMRYLSSNNWYLPSAWDGKTFLLIHDREENLVNLTEFSKLGVHLVQKLKFRDFTIFVFEQNIAKFIPGWDTSYLTPATFLPSIDSPSQTGRFIQQGGSNPAFLVADKGDLGALYYGPYVQVDAGRYSVTFNVVADFHADGVVRLDVASSPDQNIFAEATLTESDSSYTLDFTLTEAQVLEFRVWALARGKISFGGVTIQRIAE